MPKEPIEPTTPKPAEPGEPPISDPQPYKDPVNQPPADPQEDRPSRDPQPPGADVPRLRRTSLLVPTLARRYLTPIRPTVQ
jgi:hypothetical protein